MNYTESLVYLQASGLSSRQLSELLSVTARPDRIIQRSSLSEKLLRSRLSEEIITKVKTGPPKGRLSRIYSIVKKLGIDIVTPQSGQYPGTLKDLSTPPPVLYMRGNGEIGEGLFFGIVGARRCTKYGKAASEYFSTELASHGVVIVSGMAMGIDSIAHRSACDAGGTTWAVMGCGLDIVYPSSGRKLYHRILDRGKIISEHPPGTPPLKHHFPLRNRIISGLSKSILVVEAGNRSGALITAGMALDQGKDVFAIPSNIFSPVSEGVNNLIRDGAYPVTNPQEIIEFQFPALLKSKKEKNSVLRDLEDDESLVDSFLTPEGVSFDHLIRQSGLDVGNLSRILLQLELKGICKDIGGRNFACNSKSIRN